MTRPPTRVTRWLVTGAGGMLGRDVVARLEREGAAVTAVARRDLDITDRAAVAAAVAAARPDVVVHCAAWTAVDLAQEHEAQALAVNGDGAGNVAAACAAAGARMIQLSTDYVFDGAGFDTTGFDTTGFGTTGRVPYPETAVPAPVSAYGRTKLAGEQAVARLLPGRSWILRTAWLYGPHGRSFPATMIGLAARQPEVTVVADQYGQPTSTVTVAGLIAALVAADAPPGIYHATCSGQTTWHGLAQEVFRLLGTDPGRVTPIPSSALTRPAPRPAWSVLGHGAWSAAGLPAPEDWRVALHRDFPALAATVRDAAGRDAAGRAT